MRDSRPIIALCLALLGVGCLLCLTGCGKGFSSDIPTNKDMPVLKSWVAAKGKSMLPTFPESALVEIEFTPYDQLKVGDTVVFWDYTEKTGATFIHHRLIENQWGAWISRGDNKETNKRADLPWVTKDNYIARTTGRHAQILTP